MPFDVEEICAFGYPHHFWGRARRLGGKGIFFQQEHDDCGSAALKMVLDRFGLRVGYERIQARAAAPPGRTTMLGLKRIAEAEGLLCEGWRLNVRNLADIPLPAVLLLCRHHFAVVHRADRKKGIVILDPVCGRLLSSAQGLVSVWNGETLLFGDPANGCRSSPWFVPGAAPPAPGEHHPSG